MCTLTDGNVNPVKTFLTADINTKKKPLWENVDNAMRYLVRFQEKDTVSNQVRYRVFAHARVPMELREWQALFQTLEVNKINGQFEDYQPFTSKLNEKPGRMVARPTIMQMINRIKQLEDEAEVTAENEEKCRKRIKHLEDEAEVTAENEEKCRKRIKKMITKSNRMMLRIKELENAFLSTAATPKSKKIQNMGPDAPRSTTKKKKVTYS